MKKKVLFLTVSFDTGGTEKATLDIITHLDTNKYDITLMTMYGGGEYQNQLPGYVHIKYFFPCFMRYVIRYVMLAPPRLVYRTFIKEKYDIEVACGDGLPARIINHSPNLKSKKIAWIHMDVIERGYSGYEMKTKRGRDHFYSNFNMMVNVSKECERRFKEKFGTDYPTCTIYNLIDPERIRFQAMRKPSIVLDDNTFNIVCIGRLTEQKGFDRLIQAYSQIRDDSKRVRFTIIGDGIDRKILENLAREAGVQEEVVFAGYVNNPYPVLKQANLFVLSSRDESFALVVAEAMVLGVPVMSTRCTGPVELLKDGKAGLLVENSTEGIRDGLDKVLSDDIFYERMKEVAKKNRDNFDVNEQIAQIESLLDT